MKPKKTVESDEEMIAETKLHQVTEKKKQLTYSISCDNTKSEDTCVSENLRPHVEGAGAGQDAADDQDRPLEEPLPLDGRQCASGETALERRHRANVLEALVLLRVAAQKKVRQLRADCRCDCIPAAERKYLANRFAETTDRVDECIVQMIRSRRLGGGAATGHSSLTIAGMYASVYRLENRYNMDRQRYIDALPVTGSGNRRNCGLFNGCKDIMRFLCRDKSTKEDKK
ncbi:Hypothetical protein CINCED_3A001894 [Cinara cedri]|uniref:Uncharacterized protein n=1 Tax=Cinara cedri TaxID=506608 RepID=A0A5E4NHV2_9HEMI|nr:Hypothetical protein CINCED_3A001894 [Cinara cedri]